MKLFTPKGDIWPQLPCQLATLIHSVEFSPKYIYISFRGLTFLMLINLHWHAHLGTWLRTRVLTKSKLFNLDGSNCSGSWFHIKKKKRNKNVKMKINQSWRLDLFLSLPLLWVWFSFNSTYPIVHKCHNYSWKYASQVPFFRGNSSVPHNSILSAYNSASSSSSILLQFLSLQFFLRYVWFNFWDTYF